MLLNSDYISTPTHMRAIVLSVVCDGASAAEGGRPPSHRARDSPMVRRIQMRINELSICMFEVNAFRAPSARVWLALNDIRSRGRDVRVGYCVRARHSTCYQFTALAARQEFFSVFVVFIFCVCVFLSRQHIIAGIRVVFCITSFCLCACVLVPWSFWMSDCNN